MKIFALATVDRCFVTKSKHLSIDAQRNRKEKEEKINEKVNRKSSREKIICNISLLENEGNRESKGDRERVASAKTVILKRLNH